jgi:hypothetical protein
VRHKGHINLTKKLLINQTGVEEKACHTLCPKMWHKMALKDWLNSEKTLILFVF